jgi:hypothetical protein
MDGDSGLQHGQHRVLSGANLLSIKPVSITKSLHIVVGSRCPAPQGNGAGIEPDDPTLLVTTVDCHRKLFNKIRTHLNGGRGADILCYFRHFCIGKFIHAHLALHRSLKSSSGAGQP